MPLFSLGVPVSGDGNCKEAERRLRSLSRGTVVFLSQEERLARWPLQVSSLCGVWATQRGDVKFHHLFMSVIRIHKTFSFSLHPESRPNEPGFPSACLVEVLFLFTFSRKARDLCFLCLRYNFPPYLGPRSFLLTFVHHSK